MQSSLDGWLLVLISSSSCIIGASVVFIGRILENRKFLSGSMGLGAGVLFCNSQFILLPASYEKLHSVLYVAICFLCGILITAGLTKAVQYGTPHALHTCDSLPTKSYGTIDGGTIEQKDYYLIGIQTALAICIHKFPEGLIMFISNESSSDLGFRVAVAMVIHNLIEGLLIALPFYYATGSQLVSFGYASVLGGLSQPLGALIGLATVYNVKKESEEAMFGIVFGTVSGMMYMILMKSMLPQAMKSNSNRSFVLLFFVIGIALVSLLH